MCRQLGLVNLDHISIDGTKIKANASGSKLYNMERAEKERQSLKETISKKLEEMNAQDEAEDELYGQKISGYQLPEDIQNAKKR